MKKMDNDEFAGIREEITMRIQLVNTQESTAIALCVGFWAAAVALLVMEKMFLAAILFYVPVILIIPISCKSGENIYQIAVLSSYIKVFYEYASIKNKDISEKLFCWEFANAKMFKIRSHKRSDALFLFLLNNTYFMLAVISLFMYMFEICCAILNHWYTLNNKVFWIVFNALFFIAGVFFVIKIYLFSSVKRNMVEPQYKIIKEFSEIAKKLDVISQEDSDKIISEVLNGNID